MIAHLIFLGRKVPTYVQTTVELTLSINRVVIEFEFFREVMGKKLSNTLIFLIVLFNDSRIYIRLILFGH